MWTSDEGYYSKFKYVEVARYLNINGTELVARWLKDKEKKIPLLVEWDEVPTYAKLNKNIGIYTSIFRYSSDTMSDTPVHLGSLYFDIDSDDETVARYEADKLVEYLEHYMPQTAITIYFSGKKGYHIECEAIALGITPSKELSSIFRFIANQIKDELQLTTIDFAVYEPRRMWRYPNSIHQKTGLYKVLLRDWELESCTADIVEDLSRNPQAKRVVPPQEFSIYANEWYREYTYKYEQSKIQQNVTAQSIIERFNQHGSGTLDDYEKEFDPQRLFENCPAILELWNKAETTHNLEHSERLFLCSILTYTDEAIEYLHTILSNCSDYKYEKSQAHIDDWVRRRAMEIGGRPYTCQKAKDIGIVCSGCEKLEPKQKYERVGEKLYPTNELTQPSPVRLGYSRKEKD